jgi:hypothetical protein
MTHKTPFHQKCDLPYSRKYWRELNLAVEPKIAIVRILSDLNLAGVILSDRMCLINANAPPPLELK